MKKKHYLYLVLVLILSVFSIYWFSDEPFQSKKHSTLLIKNGKIYTSNPKQPWAEAMLIKDEKISFIGSSKEALKVSNNVSETINLNGKLVLPGLIDSHTHPGLVALFADVNPIPEGSIKEKLEWLKSFNKENPDLPYIIAGTWFWEDFDKNGPHKRDLDAIVNDKPVILVEDWGHSIWVNSKALEMMGVNKSTKDPVANLSFFYRDKNGEPTGWIKEFAAFPFLKKLLKINKEDLEFVLEFFLNYLSSNGVTTLFDGGNFNFDNDVYEALNKLDKEGKLHHTYEASYHVFLPEHINIAIDELKKLKKKYQSDNLNFNTIKIHFDGIKEIRTAAVSKVYNDDLHNKGNILVAEDVLTNFIEELHKEKIDLHVHTVGDFAIKTALNAYERATEKFGKLNTKLTLSHLEIMDPKDIDRMKKLNVVANFTPHWHGDPAPFLDDVLGERNKHIMKAQPLIDNQTIVTFSSDITSPAEYNRSNPFLGMQVAHNRQDIEGGKTAPIMEPLSERLDLKDLIKGYTINGAIQLKLQDKLGSLEKGKNADFIILDDNIFNSNRYNIHNIKVEYTFKNGNRVFVRNFKANVNEKLIEWLY